MSITSVSGVYFFDRLRERLLWSITIRFYLISSNSFSLITQRLFNISVVWSLYNCALNLQLNNLKSEPVASANLHFHHSYLGKTSFSFYSMIFCALIVLMACFFISRSSCFSSSTSSPNRCLAFSGFWFMRTIHRSSLFISCAPALISFSYENKSLIFL